VGALCSGAVLLFAYANHSFVFLLPPHTCRARAWLAEQCNSAGGRSAAGSLRPQVSQVFPSPRKTSPHETYVNSGGSLVMPINVPHLSNMQEIVARICLCHVVFVATILCTHHTQMYLSMWNLLTSSVDCPSRHISWFCRLISAALSRLLGLHFISQHFSIIILLFAGICC